MRLAREELALDAVSGEVVAQSSAARVSFPGGLTVSSRRSACRSAVTSSRRDIRPGAYFARGRPLLRSGAGAAGRERAARVPSPRPRSTSSSASSTSSRPVRRFGARSRRTAPLDDPVRAARHREDDDRADRRGATGAAFEEISAVSARVDDVRAVIARARDRLGGNGVRTILFIDEIHRFNKAQQDSVLHAVEDGLVTLIGATTENPYFEVNSALLSRCTVIELHRALGRGARRDPRGAARRRSRPRRRRRCSRSIATRAGGDARAALQILELAQATADAEGERARRGARARRLAQAPAPLRPQGRPALRLRLRVHQVDARRRCRRLGLLPRRDARGGRGSSLHRAPHGHPRLGGRRERGSANALVRRRRSRARARARRASRRRSSISRRPRSTSLARRSRTRPRSRSGRRARTSASTETPGRRRCSARRATPQAAKARGHGEGYVYPHDDPAGFELEYLPEPLRGRRYYRPSGNGEEER